MTVAPRRLAAVALIVRDYDEAIEFFVDRLGFSLVADTPQENGKRWVTVKPAGAETALLLARAVTEVERSTIGRQGAGRVMLFLETNDFARDHAAFTQRGVRFLEEPRREPYGIVAVFVDLYGNRWDLIESAVTAES